VDLPVDSAAPQPELVPPRAQASPDLLATLAEALEKHKQVTFTYRGMGDPSLRSEPALNVVKG